MTKKQNKISVNSMDKFVASDSKEIIIKCINKKNNEEIKVSVIPYLSLKAKGQFINDAASAVFVDGIYAPYMLDFAYKYCLLQYYTNINLPKNPEKINDIIQKTDIIEQVSKVIKDKFLYQELCQLIEYRKNVYLKHNKTDEFMEALTTLVKSLNSIANSDEFKGENFDKIVNAAIKIAGKDEKNIVNSVLEYKKTNDMQENA